MLLTYPSTHHPTPPVRRKLVPYSSALIQPGSMAGLLGVDPISAIDLGSYTGASG